MSTNNHIESRTVLGTVGGTVFTVMANISSQDIGKTVVLASLGASVSFLISLLLKWLLKKIKRMINGGG